MLKKFPRTLVGGLSLSRMIIGTNWFLGYSHTSVSADRMIRERYGSAETFKPVLETYVRYGVDTIMAPFGDSPELVRAIKESEQKTGCEIFMVDTPAINRGRHRGWPPRGAGGHRRGGRARGKAMPHPPLLLRTAGQQESGDNPAAGRLYEDDTRRRHDPRTVGAHAGDRRLRGRRRV